MGVLLTMYIITVVQEPESSRGNENGASTGKD